MNYTLIIVLLIVILSGIHGFKKGITEEISSLISWVVTLFVISLLIMLYTSFQNNEGKNTVFTVIILLAVGIVFSVVRFVLKPAKFIAKLPIFHFFDQLLGFVIGIAEGILVVWLIYVLNESGILGAYGEIIAADTARSEILSLLYEYNYLVKIAAGFQ